VSAVNHVPTMQSMVLMLRDGEGVRFFVLLRIRSEGLPAYALSPWREEGAVKISAEGDEIPDLAADVVTQGVPIPRDGAVFGWGCQGIATALIVVYVRNRLDFPMPTWSVMPLVGISQKRWPPFTDERFFGAWFWEHYRVGNIIYLGGVIAANPETVFWVGTYEVLGSDCCVVGCDIKIREGHILRSGRYLDAAALRTGAVVPSLAYLLASADKTDLAPRFAGSSTEQELT
jgi:hypothetical protein